MRRSKGKRDTSPKKSLELEGAAEKWNLLLNPQYLIPLARLPDSSPLRNPEQHWTGVVVSRLDDRPNKGQEMTYAGRLLLFLESAKSALAHLEKRGASPNFFLAGLVYSLWEPGLSQRAELAQLLSKGSSWWRSRRELLERTSKFLFETLPITRWLDEQVRRQVGLPDSGGRWERARQDLQFIIQEIKRHLEGRERRRGRYEEEKINGLIFLWSEYLREATGRPYWKRIAEILNAARLTDFPRGYLDREKIRRRASQFEKQRPGEAVDLREKLRTALRHAEKIGPKT